MQVSDVSFLVIYQMNQLHDVFMIKKSAQEEKLLISISLICARIGYFYIPPLGSGKPKNATFVPLFL